MSSYLSVALISVADSFVLGLSVCLPRVLTVCDYYQSIGYTSCVLFFGMIGGHCGYCEMDVNTTWLVSVRHLVFVCSYYVVLALVIN